MANPAIHKRSLATKRTRKVKRRYLGERYLVDERGRRVAVVLDLAEYRRLIAKRAGRSQKDRAQLVELARQARGSWKESEGSGTSVQIVRRLRDEWNRAN